MFCNKQRDSPLKRRPIFCSPSGTRVCNRRLAPSGMPVCVEPSTISFLEKMLPTSIRDAGVDARATLWDGRPRPSDRRKRLGKMSKLQGRRRKRRPSKLIQNRNKTAAERCSETHSGPAAALLLRTQFDTYLLPIRQSSSARPAPRGPPSRSPFRSRTGCYLPSRC